MTFKASKGFIRGFMKALDLNGSLKNWPDIYNSREKDCKALRGDWENVGRTIQRESRDFGRLQCGR